MKYHEHLRNIETKQELRSEKTPEHTPLDLDRVETMFVDRVEMLSSVEHLLQESQYVPLAEKLLRERQTLLDFIEADARAVKLKKQSRKVLNPDFFVQTSLDTTTL